MNEAELASFIQSYYWFIAKGVFLVVLCYAIHAAVACYKNAFELLLQGNIEVQDFEDSRSTAWLYFIAGSISGLLGAILWPLALLFLALALMWKGVSKIFNKCRDAYLSRIINKHLALALVSEDGYVRELAERYGRSNHGK